jgi:hypothetical protein
MVPGARFGVDATELPPASLVADIPVMLLIFVIGPSGLPIAFTWTPDEDDDDDDDCMAAFVVSIVKEDFWGLIRDRELLSFTALSGLNPNDLLALMPSPEV